MSTAVAAGLERSIEVSVVVPVFNAARHLPVLLASLAAQTVSSFEIVVVDDGSTDASAAILREFADRDARVRVITKTNGGVSSARNTGIAAARGHWIAFADADDWVAPTAYAAWFAQAERCRLDLLVGTQFRFDAEPPETAFARLDPVATADTPGVEQGRAWIRRAVRERAWSHYVFLQLVRADYLRRHAIRFVEGIIHEDVLWTADVALGADRVGFAPAPAYGYRATHGSLSGIACKAAAARRAEAYFTVIAGLEARAESLEDDPATRHALMLQAGLEAKHLYKLITRKPKLDQRRDLARRFGCARYPQLIARYGYGNPLRRRWRAFKARIVVSLMGLRATRIPFPVPVAVGLKP